MSYRAFKRLLGETGLERKCRYLLGTGVVLLMSLSFFIYAQQTEGLAYDQLQNTAQALIPSVISRAHLPPSERDRLDELQKTAEDRTASAVSNYHHNLYSMLSGRPEYQPPAEEQAIIQEFLRNSSKFEYYNKHATESIYYYYGTVRASEKCLICHTDSGKMESLGGKVKRDLKENDLMAVVRIRMSTELIENGFHKNRALLIVFAFGTTVLILTGTFLIVRYVIVKPLKHLKDVSEAIASGELNVRSEIQTGDEFEDLSLAFNRMLRNLTSMQDRNRNLISDLDRKVDELARVNMALYDSNRLKSDFLSTMSHELRTPLNSIIGFIEVLLNADNLSEKQHRYAGNIKTGGQQLLTLINDILDLAKIESGKLRLHPENVQPAELCEQLAVLFREQAEKKNVELKVLLAEEVATVRQDAGKLRQILANLISNAIKFTPEGGRVTLSCKRIESILQFTIEDTGVGIAPEEQELVFDKFRQSANPLTREQGGTGLGLSIVKELSRLLGGDVTLHSELGRGSTFTVRVTAELKEEPLIAFDLPEETQLSGRLSGRL